MRRERQRKAVPKKQPEWDEKKQKYIFKPIIKPSNDKSEIKP